MKKNKQPKLKKDGTPSRRGSRGTYGGHVCIVKGWQNSRDGVLTVRCVMQKVEEDREHLKWFTRYQQVQELLHEQQWRIAKIEFSSSTVAICAKVSVPMWLKNRGKEVGSSMSGSTLIIYGEELTPEERKAEEARFEQEVKVENRRLLRRARAKVNAKQKVGRALRKNRARKNVHKVDKYQSIRESRVAYMGSPFGELGSMMKEEGQKLAVFVLFIVIILVMYLFFMIVR